MRIGVFITVRLSSTRLPRKALLEIKGKPTIVHLIERMKECKHIDKIVLCTTTNIEDKELLGVAKSQNIAFFAGSEKDIIKRHYDCAFLHNLDFIINSDGDDVLTPYELVDKVALEAKEHLDIDVFECIGFPEGMNPFGYKTWCLKDIIESKYAFNNRENAWRYLLTKNPNFLKMDIKDNSKVELWSIDKILNHLKKNIKDIYI